MAELIVNELPVRTINKLSLNEEKLNIEEKSVDNTRYNDIKIVHMPKSVECIKEISNDCVVTIFAKINEKISKKNIEEEIPNNSNLRNSNQVVRTGMGIDIDEFFEKKAIRSLLIKAKENHLEKDVVRLSAKADEYGNVLSRQVIIVPDNSSLTVIMDYTSEDNFKGLVGISTRFYVGKNSELTLIKTQLLGNKTLHFDDVGGVVDDDGHVLFKQIEIGGQKSYVGVYNTLLGDRSKSTNQTGYIVGKDEKLDFNYISVQNGENTESDAVYRGVLLDNARKNWRGTIDFRKGSKDSIGDENEDTLLLSENVENRSIPIILCSEEKVDGHHGATIGQLSQDMLFYMQTRGLTKQEAGKLLIKARIDSIVSDIPDEKLVKVIENKLENIL